jgi:cell division protein FtsW (lipid II flippase)
MYQIILPLHSLVRWFVLISLLFSIYKAYKGWLTNKAFTKFDNSVRHWTATIVYIQLIFGIFLYFISPIVDYFLNNFSEAVKDNEIRFFGMEHGIMMLIGIVLITIGSLRAKKRETDKQKFKTMAIWFTIAFLIILISIPFPFSSTASRPYFRPF